MTNSVLAAGIEVLTLLIAQAVGAAILLHAHTSIDFVLVYIFGIACGGLGSRLSAMFRERVRKPRGYAKRRAA